MKYIFLDESGELGFKENVSTRFFTITLLVCGVREEQELQRIIKKIRQRTLKKKLKESSEIKWHNSNEDIRIKVLNKLITISLEVLTIILDKFKVYEYLKDKKHKLYNYLSKLILAECSMGDSFELIVDRSKNKRSLREDFDRYIRTNFKELGFNIPIKHEDSRINGGLQVLDFISGAVFNKYEFNNTKYYDIIKSKIITEKVFP